MLVLVNLLQRNSLYCKCCCWSNYCNMTVFQSVVLGCWVWVGLRRPKALGTLYVLKGRHACLCMCLLVVPTCGHAFTAPVGPSAPVMLTPLPHMSPQQHNPQPTPPHTQTPAYWMAMNGHILSLSLYLSLSLSQSLFISLSLCVCVCHFLTGDPCPPICITDTFSRFFFPILTPHLDLLRVCPPEAFTLTTHTRRGSVKATVLVQAGPHERVHTDV